MMVIKLYEFLSRIDSKLLVFKINIMQDGDTLLRMVRLRFCSYIITLLFQNGMKIRACDLKSIYEEL